MNETQGDLVTRNDAGKGNRLARFAKEHPGTALMAAAGASALLGGEFAVGALLGVGAALLFTKKTGADLRSELRSRIGSSKLRERLNAGKLRELMGSGKGWARRTLAPQHSDRATEPPV